MSKIFDLRSISELHKLLGIEPPRYPSISFIRFSEMSLSENMEFEGANVNFYTISLKTVKGQMRYGREYYDFEEGTMIFTSPNQTLYPTHLASDLEDQNGWTLFIQPDLLYATDLGRRINDYSFFHYELTEALHLSSIEKTKILESITNIVDEYSQNIDQHSGKLIISNLELLLNYCQRFYDRQFYTRSKQNKGVVMQVESLLKDYFNSDKPVLTGLPTVKYCADQVHLSPNYLSDLLKKETGKNTKEYINFFLLERAKTLLLSTDLSISEIAYSLGFEQAKSFSKLFKNKTGSSPRAFRTLN